MSMSENQKKIISQVLIQFKAESIIDEEKIVFYVKLFAKINPISKEEKEEVIRELHSKLSVRMDRGACLSEKDHISWYYSAKKDIKPDFWERYRTYLYNHEGFSTDVITALDSSTDEIMDLLGNPTLETSFARRGLVIGDVQSGKTSTYTALINKAADAGYRIIFLLTGTIEKLRRQTQGRLDAGFVGLDSTAFMKDKSNAPLGVGELDSSIFGCALTSTTSDFNTKAAQQLSIQLSSLATPCLFVLKKNKSVLEKLEQWLRVYNANSNHEINKPMLLIDDEADNASVNTKKEEDSPTAINKAIRKLLKLFTRSNYVAFTATPYANIFINPDSSDDMLKDDLFPKHFIYALEAPTNYIGARSIYTPDGKYNYMLHNNDDCEYYLPLKHKKDACTGVLPVSLREAIASFFISNAIRDLRKQDKTHRTMLVNISRFIDVQDKITEDINKYVRLLQREIKNYSLTGPRAVLHEGIAYIKSVYDKYFLTLDASAIDGERTFTWEQILKALDNAIAPIVVRSVNGGNAAKNLNYDECEEEGLRLIAVGGFSLSRGLTLEGLCISYFYRNSKMYDTLMQMGRWFGYRPHYADLCQVWMSSVSTDWYAYISEASDELRREVRKMRDMGLTPIEFGLGVRSDKNALLVTAVNKMRYTKDIPLTISLNGSVIETSYLSTSVKINEENYLNTKSFLHDLLSQGYSFADNPELAVQKPQILNVPKDKVLDYLRSFKSHYLNLDFRIEDIVELLSDYTDGTVDLWDILIATGGGDESDFCDLPFKVKAVNRRFAIKKQSNALQMSGQRAHLGSKDLAKGGLTKAQVRKITEAIKKISSPLEINKALSAEDYFSSGVCRNPLLIIYPIALSPATMSRERVLYDDIEKVKMIRSFGSAALVGLSMGIPNIDGREAKKIKYRINLIKWREMLDVDEVDYTEETGVEDD